MDFIKQFIEYINSLSNKDFIDVFEYPNTDKIEENLNLDLDPKFNLSDLTKRFNSKEDVIWHLYNKNSHNLISVIVHLNNVLGHGIDSFGYIETYNQDMDRYLEEYGDDPTIHGLPPYEEWDYLWMSDIFICEIETKNLKYRYEAGLLDHNRFTFIELKRK